jgi:SagB-type dehydrogenase family enzyme
MGDREREAVDVIVAYHERTKHQIGRYARSLGYLDWDTQPDPFRTYDGAPRVALASSPPTPQPTFDAIVHEGGVAPAPCDPESIAQFLFDSLAISAWKRFETSRWSLRCNPSSGNLHPTEGYLVLPRAAGCADTAGVFHYSPRDHVLELRRPVPDDVFARLLPALPRGAFVAGLTSIHWRESWKYGERAFRYCQHDVGHAIAALAYSASVLGWRVRVLDQVGDEVIARLLAIDDQDDIEGEVPDVLLAVEPAAATPFDRAAFAIDEFALAECAARPRLGTRNRLSADHVPWEAIEVAHAATTKAPTRPLPRGSEFGPGAPFEPRAIPARTILRQRRSAVSFDGVTGITRNAFYRTCERLMPRAGVVPFSAFGHEPAIHPVFFVNRVADLAPGLYLLPRGAGALDRLRAAMRERFRFVPAPGADESLPLVLLEEGDVKRGAAVIACQQEIAADGAFAVGFLAEFEPRLREHGAWFYRTLHHEAGALGHVLYLEAEALGIRGTGIGCFFDDEMHALLGLRDRTFQTLYHFTVGGPVDDPRIETE